MEEYKYIATCPYCGASVKTGPMFPLEHPWMNGNGYPCYNCEQDYIISPETFKLVVEQ